MKYIIREVLTEEGIKTMKVPRAEAMRQIRQLLKEDKEMLKILEKL
ncbi:MAG: hypothetical protein HYW25_04855 [Candidatus Aenigmarchaeota archaeon]|nr:hypothetical protein [Candidatus Aenigmarchaeota archaeon]